MKRSTINLTRLAILLALTLIIQLLGLPQPLTGPMINMILFLTVILLNLKAGIVLGIITPLVALWRGQLPAILAPMVPFIILGNVLLIVVFVGCMRYFRIKLEQEITLIDLVKEAAAIFFSSVVKAIFLYSTARFFVPILFGAELPAPVLFMMATPQFITALIGGFFALAVIKFLRRVGLFVRE